MAEVIRSLRGRAALPGRPRPTTRRSTMALPGGAGRTADAAPVRRGVGFAVGFKNLMFSEGFDDYSTALGAARSTDGRP